MSEEHLPAITDADLQASGLPSLMKMSPGLALYFNNAIYSRVKQIAGHMAKAEGVTPRHLLGKNEACFAVATRAITWNLDPQSVACATWQTPSGQIGYEAKLIVAIMENSGALDGRLSFEYKGDWAKLRGKFKQEVSSKGNKYFVPNWPPEAEKDLSIVVSCQIKGETTRREEEFWLEELWPRNSTLWATRPRQQATYAVSRAFSSIATPGLIMGLPFDVDPGALGDSDMQDITPPKPTKSEFERSVRDDPKHQEFTARLNFVDTAEAIAKVRAEGLKELSPDIHDRWNEQCEMRLGQIPKPAEEKQQPSTQPEPEPEQSNPVPSDDDYKTLWGERLATTKEVKDVADLRAEGEKELPAHLQDEWKKACDARTKAITEKPRSKPKAKAAAEPKPDPAADTTHEETPLGRGKRLLNGSLMKTPDDVQDLCGAIAEELSGTDLIEWNQACQDKIAALGA